MLNILMLQRVLMFVLMLPFLSLGQSLVWKAHGTHYTRECISVRSPVTMERVLDAARERLDQNATLMFVHLWLFEEGATPVSPSVWPLLDITYDQWRSLDRRKYEELGFIAEWISIGEQATVRVRWPDGRVESIGIRGTGDADLIPTACGTFKLLHISYKRKRMVIGRYTDKPADEDEIAQVYLQGPEGFTSECALIGAAFIRTSIPFADMTVLIRADSWFFDGVFPAAYPFANLRPPLTPRELPDHPMFVCTFTDDKPRCIVPRRSP